MNVYIQFDKNGPNIRTGMTPALTSAIQDVIYRCAGLRKVPVHFYMSNNHGKDIAIVLDQYPKGSLQNSRNVVYQIRDEIAMMIPNYLSRKLKNGVSIMVDTEYTPSIEEDERTDTASNEKPKAESSEFDYEQKALLYQATNPTYTFERVILPKPVREKIENALAIVEYEKKVFDEWGLYAIQPNPSTALSFYGPSGTGKTMAAEAIAEKMGRKILKVGYADIESKFHGEGPKMVKAIFMAAQRDNAVLFIDEADSLLSKRLTNVTQGSEQAINSMRSQLLICLEEFKGIVIFATNLIVNYDQAFLTRLISIPFIEPDEESRKKIWDVHIKPVGNNGLRIPLSYDVDTASLAKQFHFVGRQIRKAVISACVRTVMQGRDVVYQEDLVVASRQVLEEEEQLKQARGVGKSTSESSFSPEQDKLIKGVLQNHTSEAKN